jgi:glycosyltransferase involved in cell wall biosynthesis
MSRLVLALEYPLMQQGGTEVLVRELLRAFAAEHEVVLVSGDRNRAALPPEIAARLDGHLAWHHQAAQPSAAARALARELQHRRPDLIHWHLGFTYAWRSNRFWQSPIHHAARLGLPSLCTTHLATELLDSNCDLARPVWQKQFILLRAWPSRLLAHRGIAREVCVSQHDARLLRTHFPPRRRRVSQLYHSLLREEGAPPVESQREKVVLCVGTIGGRKAQHILAEAFCRIAAQHRDWQLEIVGRAPMPAEIERIQASIARHGAGAQVHLPGRLSDAEVLEKVRSAAIFAMPSLHEGLGLSLQEALFHGCVAVGTRAGGIPELIDHERNGLLVTPGSVEELSAALDRLMSDDALRRRLASETRPSILRKEMTAEAMIANYRRLYHELLPFSTPRP